MLLGSIRIYVYMLCACIYVCAQQANRLDIEAGQVFADEKKGITTAKGNVKMKKGEDRLNADIVHIYVDNERKPTRFEAEGNVDFFLLTDDGRRLKGKSKKLIYIVTENEYQLLGQAEIQEIGKPNFLQGETIVLNNHNGYANVQSDNNAPVRVIIDLSEQDTPKQDTSTQDMPKPSQQEQESTHKKSSTSPTLTSPSPLDAKSEASPTSSSSNAKSMDARSKPTSSSPSATSHPPHPINSTTPTNTPK